MHSNQLDDNAIFSSPTQYFDTLEDQPSDHESEYNIEEDDAAYWSDSFELPPLELAFVARSNTISDAIDEPNADGNSFHDSSEEEAIQMPRKRGRKAISTFPLPPQGELAHPFEGWIIDKAAMYEYMPNYAKQEGCALNTYKEWHGHVIRWRCIHYGKHNNHRNLPTEVTEKSQRQTDTAEGIIQSMHQLLNL